MFSRRFALALVLLVGGLSSLGCGGGPQCVIDTDCPLGQRCASDDTCQPIGADIDSGTRQDAGPGRDGSAGEGGVDASRVDASSDAATGEDAEVDADVDASTGGAMMMPPPAE